MQEQSGYMGAAIYLHFAQPQINFKHMKRLIFFILFSFSSFLVFAQLQDNFSDGNFSSDPEWFGDTERFIVSAEELQLSDGAPESSNTSFLSLGAPTSIDAATIWEFYVRLEFSPSSSNFARIYLNATNADLTASQNSYYVQVGGISGSTDALELVRQDGSDRTVLIGGVAGAVGSDPAIASVRVTRSTSGNWELWADYTGGTDYELQGSATDATYTGGNFFGFYCKYTSTRNESMFFDNVLVDPLFEDTVIPQLVEAVALAADEVEVRFSEPISVSSASSTSNYSIDNSIGNPVDATPDSGDPSIILLQLSSALTSMQDYVLTIDNINDLSGNNSNMQTASFTFVETVDAQPDDIIVSEIMADPSPQVGLPNTEFVELYNRSDKAIQLDNYGLASGGSPERLPSYLFLPGSYVVITDATIAATLKTLAASLL